jgi:predicted acylesterase/phospholipase RssA
MEIHTTGYAWRYIRASMTLTGFLPPMTDEEGNMLVDGGYMDNLTVFYLVFRIDRVGRCDERYGSRCHICR